MINWLEIWKVSVSIVTISLSSVVLSVRDLAPGYDGSIGKVLQQ